MIDLSRFEGHTEGPWFFTTFNDHTGVEMISIETKDEKIIALSNSEILSDWALIASAPELLEELKQLRSMIETNIFNTEDENLALQAVINGNIVLKNSIVEIKESVKEYVESLILLEENYGKHVAERFGFARKKMYELVGIEL